MTADPTALAIEVAAVTDRGLSEKRPENEDSMLSDPEHRIFAVADGVGGAQAGEVASQTAIEVLQEAFTNQHAGEDVEDLMEIAIQRANDSIYRMSREQPRFAMMATTIVALHLDGLRATVGHVGDSRLYRLAPDGRLSRETEDHSVVEEGSRGAHPEHAATPRTATHQPRARAEPRSSWHAHLTWRGGTVFRLARTITRHAPPASCPPCCATRGLEDACAEMTRRCFERGARTNAGLAVRVAPTSGARRQRGRPTLRQNSSLERPTITPTATVAPPSAFDRRRGWGGRPPAPRRRARPRPRTDTRPG